MNKMVRLACAAALLASGAASADDGFPFAKSVQSLNFSDGSAEVEFQRIVEEAAATPLIYLDWQFAGFTSNEVFEQLGPHAGEDRDAAACEQLDRRPVGTVTVSGRPNKDNNHLLATIVLSKNEADPFASAVCENFGSSGEQGLRIRGFFYVTDIRIATANHYAFRPVMIDATRIPAKFFN